MFSNILMYVCLAGIAVSIPVCIALWLNQLDVHPLARLLASFRFCRADDLVRFR